MKMLTNIFWELLLYNYNSSNEIRILANTEEIIALCFYGLRAELPRKRHLSKIHASSQVSRGHKTQVESFPDIPTHCSA